MAEIVDFGLQKHKIKMDSRYFDNVLSVVAGDTGRRIEVQLLDTNGMVQNTTGLNLRLNAIVEGKATYTDATLVDAATGNYQLDLSNGMFLAPGDWQFQWQITDAAGKKLHSFAFTASVGKNISDGSEQATNFYLNAEELRLKTIELQTDFDKLGTQFKKIIDETTGKDVISAPEIIAARKGEASLNARLTKNEQETTARLAQTKNETDARFIKLESEKASINYVDAVLMDIVKGGPNGPKGPFNSINALKSAYPNGTEGTWLVFDSSFSDGAHSFIWDSTNSIWKDLGAYQALALSDNSVDLNALSVDVRKAVYKSIALEHGYNKTLIDTWEVGGVDASKNLDVSNNNYQPYAIRTPSHIVGDGKSLIINVKEGHTLGLRKFQADKTFVNYRDFKSTEPTEIILEYGFLYRFMFFNNSLVNDKTIFELSQNVLIAKSEDLTYDHKKAIDLSYIDKSLIWYDSNSIQPEKLTEQQATNNGTRMGFVGGGFEYNESKELIFQTPNQQTLFNFYIPKSKISELTKTGFTVQMLIKSTGVVARPSLKMYSIGTAGNSFKLTASRHSLNSEYSMYSLYYDLSGLSDSALSIFLQDNVTTTGGFTIKDFRIVKGRNVVPSGYDYVSLKKSFYPYKLEGKSVNFVGDSLTEQQRYVWEVINKTGVTSQGNKGLGSSTMAINNNYLTNKSLVERVMGLNGNAAYEDAEIWTILIGLNDWYYNSPLGNLDSTDNDEFCGALINTINHINNRPNKPKLLLITPSHSNRDNQLNEAGYEMKDIIKAIKDVGELMGVPVCDVWSKSGINKFNIQSPENPTTNDGVHWTDFGASLAANVIISDLKSITG